MEISEIGSHSSNDFVWKWQVIKKLDEKMSIILHHQSLDLNQVWTLNCQENNILEINIDLEINKTPLSLVNQAVVLSVIENYTKWKTLYEEGTLSTKEFVGDADSIRLKHNKVSKILLETKDDGNFPKLTFGCSGSGNVQLLGIGKRKDKQCTFLRLSKLVSRKNQEIPIGKYNFFSGRIILDRDVPLGENRRSTFCQISKGNLKVVFDEGRGRIFWKDKELTCGLGMYTSICSSGIWRDSAQALWRAEQIENNRMIFNGDWAYIPISQVWQVNIISENLIHWKVEMEIYDQVNLEIEQSNLMLSSQYKSWGIPDLIKGEFLDEFTEDYEVSPYRFYYGKVDEIGFGVTDKRLPSILFKIEGKKDDSFRTVIENTDCLYKARRLQYQRAKVAKKMLPEKYKYFEGTIKVEPKM